MFFFDTIAPMGHTSAILWKEMTYAFWKSDFCPAHGFSTDVRIPSMYPTVPWSLQNMLIELTPNRLSARSLHKQLPVWGIVGSPKIAYSPDSNTRSNMPEDA